MGPGGLEPPTPRLSSVCSNQLSYEPLLVNSGGAERVRTDDLLNANQPLFQLSYGPFQIQRFHRTSTIRLSIHLRPCSFRRIVGISYFNELSRPFKTY